MQFIEVRYEAIHEDGPGVLRNLVNWMGLNWTDEEIRVALDKNSPEAARAGGGTPIRLGGAFANTLGPVVKEPPGFIRQARAGTWRNDLTFLDRVAVWRVARSTMAEVGYPWTTPWSA
jgi:hypothetical protein